MKNVALIILNPIFEERSRSHRYLFNWAKFLAHHGYHVIRFDYMGQGDSDGDMKNMSIETQLDDLAVVQEWVKQKLPDCKIALHGLRWGASIGALYMQSKNVDLKYLVSWEPIKNGRKYIEDELRKNLATQLIVHKRVIVNRKKLVSNLESGEYVNIDGYLISPTFWKLIDQVTISDDQYMAPTLEYEFIKRAKKQEPVEAVTVEVINDSLTRIRSKVPEFYKEIPTYDNHNELLFNSTLDWICKFE